ncbi:MAG: hypothetical protein RR704_00840 [Stenotrophomonas sp.]
MSELIDDLIFRLRDEYGASDTKDLVCKLYERIQAMHSEAASDVFDAYKTWPADLKAKLSVNDLRRMNGWAPRVNAGDWRIDTSAGGPILVYKNCSVIEGEDARYVLGLIAKDATPRGIDGYQGAFYELADMLGMTAQPSSPKEVWETQMRPALQAALAARNHVFPEAKGMREQFEAWAKSVDLETKIYAHNNMYSHPVTRGAWIAWEALARVKGGVA